MPKIGPKKFQAGSVGDLSAQEALEDIGGLDPGELADKGKDHNPGRGIYRRKLEEFTALNDEDKKAALVETWKEVAMGAATRAKAFVATCAPKDFGSLHKLITAAAVGIEQAFPKAHDAPNTQFIINMFGSLGQRAAAIASPPVPMITVEEAPLPGAELPASNPQPPITVEATEVPWPSSESTNETTSLLKTKTEISATTMPSLPLSSTPSQ